MKNYMDDRNEKGFTLIELLIAIVVVGILAAVAIVGIGGLTKTAGGASCKATADAARTSSAAFYAAHDNNWPTSFTDLTSDNPPMFDKGSLTVAGDTVSNGTAWKLVGTFPGTDTAPTFNTAAVGNCGN
jgi:type IV pilus assembly protein PilA